MDLDDIFKKMLRSNSKQHKHGYKVQGDRSRHHDPTIFFHLPQILHNKTILGAIVIGFLFVGGLGIAVFFAVVPLIESFFDSTQPFLQENGIKGVVDAARPYAEKIWTGSK